MSERNKIFTVSDMNSFKNALRSATSGHEIVLKDGEYRHHGTLEIHTPGVVIRAEHKHGAKFINTDQADTFRNRAIHIRADKVTIRGLVVDNQDRGNAGIQIDGDHFMVEHNFITHSGGPGIGMGEARDGTIRFNFIEHTGYTPRRDSVGREGLNLGGYDFGFTGHTDVYGNTITDSAWHPIEFKENSEGFNVHHNIFENSRDADFGNSIWIRGRNNRFQNNIVRNGDAFFEIFGVTASGNNHLSDNVIININGNAAVNINSSFNDSDTVIAHNTFHNTPDTIRGGSGLKMVNNRFNAPQSACNDEVNRILHEMKTLPGADPSAEGSGIIITASDYSSPYYPGRTMDENLDDESRWSAKGANQWIQYDLPEVTDISTVSIAWLDWNGATTFQIEVSDDGQHFRQVFNGASQGHNRNFEDYPISARAQSVRIVCHGNAENPWNSIVEVKFTPTPDRV